MTANKKINEIRAKKHAILKDLTSELKKGFIEDTVELMGHKFKLKTLTEEEDNWSDNFIVSASSAGMLSSMRVPKLAVAIREIDGVSVDQLFEFPESEEDDERRKKLHEAIKNDSVKFRYWVRDQMMLWLSEESNRPFILKLWDAYMGLEKRREEAVTAIPN